MNEPTGEKRKAELVKVLAIVIAALICISGLFMLSKHLHAKRPPESAEATIVRVDTSENPDYMKSVINRSDSRVLHYPIYSFTASNGVTYEVRGESRTDTPLARPSVGDTSTIYYYPEHPDYDYMLEADQKFKLSWDIYFVAFPVLFVIVLFATRREKASEAKWTDE